jgi:predicted ATPase/class 3 adenylate cyclase
MEYAILGPLRVVVESRDIAPAAAKPRALLVRMLIDANRAVAAETLVDDLWSGMPPRSAATTLQGYISQLRKVLGPERLVTRAGGYELVVGPGELDAEVLDSVVTDARRRLSTNDFAGAADAFDRAIAMWSGVALADAAGAQWATPTASRLEELRIVAVEGLLEANLGRGACKEVLTAAESAIAAYPLRERLWAHYMSALYLDGRQADALRAFQRLRQYLGDELGIAPSRDIVELEARIVRQEDLRPFPGAAPVGAMPGSTPTLTFMFTDLETSTRMWEEHQAAMQRALARHDDLMRDAVEYHGGRVVKTTGDGTLAVFDNAVHATHAAAKAQRALSAEPWGETGPLRARIALHTGVAETRDGDYFGPTLNRAARLAAIAHGGQILVSRSTEAVVRDEAGVELCDLGDHRLKDLARPERVFQLMVSGLSNEFAPLRSLGVERTNLPVQLTSFVGRAHELERARKLVSEHRAVTITGVGGVGKTRIALQVAREMIGDFEDGTWVCELAAVTDEDAMLPMVVSTLRVTPRSGSTLEESIAEHLRHKVMLLVLDNCEHLLASLARLVDRILRAGGGIRVLATSREALDVDGEQTLPLRSMTVAASDDLDDVGGSDAAQLFLDRARNARADFILDSSNAAAVNTICRRLDGIPLAIELAAARVVSMSPPEIAGLLDERFRLLTGGRRLALERHQTLRAAVDWSYALLTPLEQSAFERLAVFAGTFDSAAARAVVADESVAEWDVIDALDGLVRKSLVIAEEQARGGTRYQMLETLRQYARERLDEHGDSDKWRRRHAEYYAAFGTAIRKGLLGPDEFAWRDRRDAEIDNIRAATSWAIDCEDTALMIPLIFDGSEEAMVLWNRMGRPASRALPLIDRFDTMGQVALLMLAALEAFALGDMEEADRLERRSEERADSFHVTQIHLIIRQAFGPDFYHSAFRERAVAALRENPNVLDQTDLSLADRARLHSTLASYLNQTDGDRAFALQLARTAETLARESRNPTSLALARFSYGLITAADEPDIALAAFEDCIELGKMGSMVGGGGPYYISALLLARRGELALAQERLRASFELLAPHGRNPELDGAFGYAIEVGQLLGRLDICAVLMGAVLDGVLTSLRNVPLPPDRSVPNVRAIRETLGREQFESYVRHGADMSYDELVAWLIAALSETPRVLPRGS